MNLIKTLDIVFSKRSNYLLPSILIFIALVGSLFNDYALVFLLIGAYLFTVSIYGKKVLIAGSIITFLAVPSSISIEIRTLIQVFNFLLLFYLFIEKYGLEFHKYPRVPVIVSVFIGVFISIILLSSLFSEYRTEGIVQLFRTIAFFILVYLYYSVVDSKDIKQIFSGSLFVIGFVYFIFLFYQLFLFDYNMIEMAITGLDVEKNTYINKNAIGIVFLIVICLSLIEYLFRKDLLRYIYLIFFVLFFIGIILTTSRAAILSNFVAISIIFLYKYRWKFVYTFLVIIVTSLLIIFNTPLYDSLSTLFRFENLLSGRDFIWNVTSELISDNSFWGYGPAATKFYVYKSLPYLIGTPQEMWIASKYDLVDYGFAHNFYLFMFTDLGFPGLLISISLPFVYFKTLLRKNINNSPKINNEYRVLFFALGVAFFVRGLFEWANMLSYGQILYDLPFWLIIVLLLHLTFKEEIDEQKIF
ncbi:MAG: O-antigen ligase family protein [Melioribacteraceae bacterium]|nr:O-antigen ligase family protein [Melioribacteraceae bacterium]